ncbi:MAG: bifunctional folylpolyglutamate synthase/dihydrofolate synthase [Chloroflexi bacterium]|nr:bifunctional folylpolyglutamate synthase/dihydrofolate synthase [Chloroflexota bacterium]
MPYERYFEAVDYLQRRLWHELPIVPVERALQRRVRHVLEHLGNPHLWFPVVHVGGSAGKGSTTAITASILRAAVLRTGTYTSPHLQTFVERYDVDGRLVDPGRFADLVLGLDPLVRQMHLEVLDGVGYGRPALVEATFAAGMRHFADEDCAAAVVEVGLGGRTDCTNVFEDKPVTVITNIEFEHTERLGATRASIAREKAALIRGREVFVTGERHRDALEVLEARCAETGATPWRLGREIRLRHHAPVSGDVPGERFDLASPLGSFRDLRVALTGEHQARNAALAVAAALAFGDRTGLLITEDHVRAGLERVWISGRMEQVQSEPLVLLDSAHNPVEARALATALRDHYLRRGVRLHLVCGILADKDQVSMVRAFAAVANTVAVTQPALVERIGDPGRMLELFRARLGAKNVTFVEEPASALDDALSRARPRDVVCVTGSMFLVGAVRERWVPEGRILKRRSAALRGNGE